MECDAQLMIRLQAQPPRLSGLRRAAGPPRRRPIGLGEVVAEAAWQCSEEEEEEEGPSPRRCRYAEQRGENAVELGRCGREELTELRKVTGRQLAHHNLGTSEGVLRRKPEEEEGDAVAMRRSSEGRTWRVDVGERKPNWAPIQCARSVFIAAGET
eukprot:200364-Hanusia_phi.AAC.1